MPTFDDTRDQIAPSLLHPVTEVLSRYLAMTAPARSRASADDRTLPSSEAGRSDGSVQIQTEELWDALGDFA
jgi:hypothetical protein